MLLSLRVVSFLRVATEPFVQVWLSLIYSLFSTTGFSFTILLICFTFIVGLFFVFVVVVMSWFCRFLSHSIIVTTFLFCCRCFNIFSRFLVLISYNNFKWVFRRMLLFIYVSFYAVMCSVVILVISHIRNLLNKYLYISYSYYLSSHTV